MKNLTLTILLSLFINLYYSQNEELNVDLLKAPASPASNLLGIATSDINKPTDVSNLMLGLHNLSSGLLSNNSGYSVDFAPFWIFPGKKNMTLNNIILDDDIKSTIKQTFVFSVAIKNSDSTSVDLPSNSIYTAYGFKLSLKRGKAEGAKIALDSILGYQKKINEINFNDIDSDEIRSLNNQIDIMIALAKTAEEKLKVVESEGFKDITSKINTLIQLKMEESRKISKFDEYSNQIKALTDKLINFERTGILWDIAGGSSIQFRDKIFNNSKIYNIGLWSVFGYAFKKSGTPLLLLRYMYNPDSDWLTTSGVLTEDNFSTFDAGLKYQYSPEKSKFTGSMEGIYRSFISGIEYKPDWKFIFNLDYEIWTNNHITLSLGKDFDNNIIKKGNAIAAISFIAGLGTKREVN